jgi:hypothetical protein
MGKAINIKDEATCELVAELAAKAGVSLVQAVNMAVKGRLETLAAERLTQAKSWLADVKSHRVDNDFMTNRWQPPLEEPKT